MLNLKITISVAAMVCSLLIISGTAPQASAQFLPAGSYQKSCKNIKTDGATLKAFCNGGSGKLGFPDLNTDSELPDFFECEGSIWNDDATLKCNRNPNSALMQKAKSALDAGYNNVYGGNTNKSIGASLGSFLAGTSIDYKFHLRELFKAGYAQKFYEGNLGGMTNLGLLDYFQTWLSKSENSGIKSDVINRAFYEVYNYGPSPKDMAFYTSSKTGFNTILYAEQKKMNGDKAVRRLMISAAYKHTMGRNPTAEEFDYWQPKQEYYTQIVELNRSFLYAPSGAKDLAETIKRALNKNGNNPNPDIDQINKAITRYSKNKYIYDQMN